MNLKDAGNFIAKKFPKNFLDKIFLKPDGETIITQYCNRPVWQVYSMGKTFASIYKDNNIQIYLVLEHGQLVVVYDCFDTYYDLGLDNMTGYNGCGYVLTREEYINIVENLNKKKKKKKRIIVIK